MSAKFEQAKQYPLPLAMITVALEDPDFFKSEKFRFVKSRSHQRGMMYHYQHAGGFRSFGENVLITMAPTETGETEVNVFSECASPTQLVDWGQNQTNVTSAFNRLEQYISTVTPPPQPQHGCQCPVCQQSLPIGSHYCAFCGNTF